MAKILLLDDDPEILSQALEAIPGEPVSILLVPEFLLIPDKRWRENSQAYTHTLVIATGDNPSPEALNSLVSRTKRRFGSEPEMAPDVFPEDGHIFGIVKGHRRMNALLSSASQVHEDLVYCSSAYEYLPASELIDIVVSDTDLSGAPNPQHEGYEIITDLIEKTGRRVQGLLYSSKPDLQQHFTFVERASVRTYTKQINEPFNADFREIVGVFFECVRDRERYEAISVFKDFKAAAHNLTHTCCESEYMWADNPDTDSQVPEKIKDPAACAGWWEKVVPRLEPTFEQFVPHMPPDMAEDVRSVVAEVNGRIAATPSLNPSDPAQARIAIDTAVAIRQLYSRISWPLSTILYPDDSPLPHELLVGSLPESFRTRIFLYAGRSGEPGANLVRSRLSPIAGCLRAPWHWQCIGEESDQPRWIVAWQESAPAGETRGGPFGYDRFADFVRRSDPANPGMKEGWGWLYDLALSFDVYLKRITGGPDGKRQELARLTWKYGLDTPSGSHLPPGLESIEENASLMILLKA